MNRIKRKLSRILKYWAWILVGKPTTTALPVYYNGKLIAYDEYPLDSEGLPYVEEGSNKWTSLQRRLFVYFFDLREIPDDATICAATIRIHKER